VTDGARTALAEFGRSDSAATVHVDADRGESTTAITYRVDANPVAEPHGPRMDRRICRLSARP
jgi:hypothetical protein